LENQVVKRSCLSTGIWWGVSLTSCFRSERTKRFRAPACISGDSCTKRSRFSLVPPRCHPASGFTQL